MGEAHRTHWSTPSHAPARPRHGPAAGWRQLRGMSGSQRGDCFPTYIARRKGAGHTLYTWDRTLGRIGPRGTIVTVSYHIRKPTQRYEARLPGYGTGQDARLGIIVIWLAWEIIGVGKGVMVARVQGRRQFVCRDDVRSACEHGPNSDHTVIELLQLSSMLFGNKRCSYHLWHIELP